MSFINNTECSSYVQLPSIGDRQMACITNVRVWFIAHYVITLGVHTLCLSVVFFLWWSYLIAFLFYPRVRGLTDVIYLNVRLRSYGNARNFSYAFALLLRDVWCVLIYVSSAFLYEHLRSIRSGHRIRVMNLQLWMIEAINVPFLLIGLLISRVFGLVDLMFDRKQTSHIILVLVKIPQLISMRYLESDLIHLEAGYVIRICEKYVAGRS